MTPSARKAVLLTDKPIHVRLTVAQSINEGRAEAPVTEAPATTAPVTTRRRRQLRFQGQGGPSLR